MPRLSSSVVLLRPTKALLNGKSNFEVLLAQRSSKMNAFSSFHVFPGGVHEAQDETDAKAYQNDPDAALKITGLRELFEEAGVLLTGNRKNSRYAHAIRLDSEASAKWQQQVHDNAVNYSVLLKILDKTPAISSLHYWVTFITPLIEKRRFKTHFYVAVVDDANIVLDGGETVRYQWICPQDALALNAKGELKMLPPQYFVFNTLGKYNTIDEVLNGAVTTPRRLPILPHAIGINDDDELVLVYPGDEQHPEYPGKPGRRRRINCKQPLGTHGYRWECNFPEEPTLSNL